MARNFPGPYAVELLYTATIGTQTLVHSLELNCVTVGTPAVGAVPGSIALQTKSGASLALLTAVNDVWNILRPGMSASGTTCQGFTLWRYVPGTLAKDFITAGTVTNPAATGAGQPQSARQTKLTFRSANGGIMQFNNLEGIDNADTRTPLIPAGTGAWWVVMAAYLLSASGWAIARDDAYPVAALNVSRGQNEVVFNKRWRAN